MALSYSDWESIYSAINSSQRGSEVVVGKVVKSNQKNMVVWLKEFGDQPIPCVGFAYEAIFYDETPLKTKRKTANVRAKVPKKGDIVVVLRQLGERRLARCVGVILAPPKAYISKDVDGS
jgi:hypothetical protein